MKSSEPQQNVLDRLVSWADKQDLIRAMLLFSSRANPHAPVDRFSDYDILLAVTDVRRFHEEDAWLHDFGKLLVVFRNPFGTEHGFKCFGFVTHYQEGVKIDYCFYPVEYLTWVARQPRLPADLDHGYKVLIDKDHLTDGLQSPSYSAHLPTPPTEDEYRAVIEEFFNDSLYVAKHLWRDNLFPMKLSLDHIMKFNCLRRMLEWRLGAETGWSVRPGAYGKGLKGSIETELWAELEATYVGAGTAENWEALFRTINLFRKIAQEVAERLNYVYPQEIDRGVVDYLERIRGLDRNLTTDFGAD
jgi:aminoglycoside 6-adenylyltransferase